MEVEDYIEIIINNGKIEDMHKLSEILDDLMEKIKIYDESCYKDYKMQLYEMAFGNTLSDELKVKWVKQMRPSYKWELNEIEQVAMNHGVNIPLYSFYAIMNMFYSDMQNVLGSGDSQESLEKYIQASNDWYYDEDATNTQEAKLYFYWKNIVN